MSAVASPARGWLRLEALAAGAAGLLVWAGLDGGWWWFALLIFVPDLSLAGYIWGPRVGAALYNVAHSYALPVLLGVAGGMLDQRSLLLTSAIWLTHIGANRALGYGLKYSTGFHDTHLGRVGRQPLPQVLQRTGEHLIQLLHQSEGPHAGPFDSGTITGQYRTR
jgi:hypothetical protein